MLNTKVNIKRTESSDKDFTHLIHALDKELTKRYGKIQKTFNKHNYIEPNNAVIIATIYNKPIGCGCFKTYDKSSIEIKRMFVKQEYRGLGVSKLILNELENWAKMLGFNRAILETGIKQPEAIGLYKNHGYLQIENYGQYKNVVTSVCFEKNF